MEVRLNPVEVKDRLRRWMAGEWLGSIYPHTQTHGEATAAWQDDLLSLASDRVSELLIAERERCAALLDRQADDWGRAADRGVFTPESAIHSVRAHVLHLAANDLRALE